jgi:hypothetical protein
MDYVGCTVLQLGGGEGEHYLHRKLASGTLEISIKKQIQCKNREFFTRQRDFSLFVHKRS